MNGKRLWQIGGFLVVVIVFALGWFVLVSPALKTVDGNNAQRAAVAAKNAQIQTDIANLSKVDVAALKQQLATRIAQIPTDLIEEKIFDEVKDVAAQAGVEVTSISISEAQPFQTDQKSSVGVTSDPAAAGSGPAAIAVPGLPITQEDIATANGAGLFDSSLSLAVNGDFAAVRQFVNLLTKQSPRTFLVTAASLNAGGGGMNITATIWFKPRTEDLLTDPAPAPSDSPTASPAPSAAPSDTPTGVSPTPTSGASGTPSSTPTP